MPAEKGNCYNPEGRPPKEIDWEMFEQLCALQCTQDEMSGFLHVCGETLSNRVQQHYGEDYSTIYKRFSETGKCSLRRNQFVLSKTNAAIAIWLGKQWLGQKENIPEAQVSDDIDKRYIAVMEQLLALQSARKIETNTNNNAQ